MSHPLALDMVTSGTCQDSAAREPLGSPRLSVSTPRTMRPTPAVWGVETNVDLVWRESFPAGGDAVCGPGLTGSRNSSERVRAFKWTLPRTCL